MTALVSIIIPLYKGEKYIVKCLDSITQQKYSNFEIVIVNDESPDRSVDVIKEYVKHNAANLNIRVIHQPNQGQGAARNTGIAEAKGEYLMFVDQDDTLEPEILTKLLKIAINNDADIVSCGYSRVDDTGKVKMEVHLEQTEWSKYKVIAPWAKLYKASFIKDNNIKFLPVVLGEDIYFMMKAYSYLPKICFQSDIGYNWMDNTVSVSNTAHKKLEENTSVLRLFNMLEGLENKDNLRNDCLYEYFLIKTAVWDILYTVRNNSFKTVKHNNEQIWNWFDAHFPKYMSNPYIKISEPKGEAFSIRLIVWGYMMIKRVRLENVFLRILSK